MNLHIPAPGYSLSFLIGLIILYECTSCSRQTYPPSTTHETVRIDTLYRLSHRTDSIILRDSVLFFQIGDTVKQTVIRERIRIHTLTDTLHHLRVDTLHIKEIIPVDTHSTTRNSNHRTGVTDLLLRPLFSLLLISLLIYAWCHFSTRKS
ncbi:MAG: hypothetical protein HDS82_07425 [Bacteroidales bacterium]|nr:hypothetical protein [Bacteroidales bacterium]